MERHAETILNAARITHQVEKHVAAARLVILEEFESDYWGKAVNERHVYVDCERQIKALEGAIGALAAGAALLRAATWPTQADYDAWVPGSDYDLPTDGQL